MITPELIGYIKGEFAKGRTREDIRAELVRNGGWSEVDLNEGFRMAIPMQNFVAPSATNQYTINPEVKSEKKLSRKTSENLIFIIVALICLVVWYFYQPQIIGFWNSGVDNIKGLFSSYFSPKTPETADTSTAGDSNNGVASDATSAKDCGTSTAPDLKNATTTISHISVLNCLGTSALSCENAKAVLKSDLFPDVFQIIKTGETCNFKLSYGLDSTLFDRAGKKLAGQSISCPVNIVKAIDESKNPPTFTAPSKDNPVKYASQIHFYGSLGVFVENNLEKNKIQNLGCSGSYIDSVITSYNRMQSQ
ncbi:hypothetical protein A2917_00520 [Candidatus Nomurabacteria bacterium RIFCSPLOWO2_01_FULL_42_17]|uniref:Uncharacterized protein n=1 Tax=Candidatus Nomurabacteria bacterium RIFCSPLOWO2_01_FULL_42_17 TaxID=1801780 RepID=A0A1F6XNW2_9BACT|nr:MAG: hypothetical protein A2917_00520 [Candidatus Nomurabacteria bacterium RIFCSPLOWO2_01_FULL_42_17]